MSTSVNPSEPVTASGPLPSLSAWSVISLILFVLAILVLVLAVLFVPHRAVGPADAAALTFLLFVSVAAEFGGTLLGVLAGWVGIRRSRGYPELPWAGLALNSALLLLQLVLPIILLAVSEPGATWIVVPMIVVVGTVFAALAGARGFVKALNDRVHSGWGLWWVWFLGVACGTAVMALILIPMRPG